MRRRITARLAQLRYAAIVRDVLAKVNGIYLKQEGNIAFIIGLSKSIDLNKNDNNLWNAPQISKNEVKAEFDPEKTTVITYSMRLEVPGIGPYNEVNLSVWVGPVNKNHLSIKMGLDKEYMSKDCIEQFKSSSDQYVRQFYEDFGRERDFDANGDEYLEYFRDKFVNAVNQPENYAELKKGQMEKSQAEKIVFDKLMEIGTDLQGKATEMIRDSIKDALDEWIEDKYKFNVSSDGSGQKEPAGDAPAGDAVPGNPATEGGAGNQSGDTGKAGETNNGDAGESVVNKGQGKNYGSNVYLVFDVKGNEKSAHPDGNGDVPARATRKELEELARSGKLQYKINQKTNRRYVVDSNGTALTFKRARGNKYLSSLPAVMRNLNTEYQG